MAKRKSKHEAVTQFIDDALASMNEHQPVDQGGASERFDHNAANASRLESIDAELKKIRERYDHGKINIVQFRRDGAQAILLLTERYVITDGLWLVAAHGIAVALDNLAAGITPISPLLRPESEMDEHVSLWASYYEPQIKPNAIAAGLILRRYCNLNAETAAESVASVLSRMSYRSRRGTRTAPEGAAIVKWMRATLNLKEDRSSVLEEVQAYAKSLGIPRDDETPIEKAEIEQMLSNSLEEIIMFKAPKSP